jgi:hypothetical protein
VSRGGGCLPVLALLTSPCWIPYGIASFATPVLAPHVYLDHPASFAHDRPLWYTLLGAVPIIAFVLVRWASPADGRLRDRSTPRRKGRPHPVRGYTDRVLLLVAATSAVTFWLMLRGNDMQGAEAGAETVRLLAALTGTLAVTLTGIHFWDRPRVPPVTVEQVRAHHRRAQKELRRIRSDNERVTAMVVRLEAKLAEAHSRRDFATLRTMHHESYGCADSVYAHYRSVEDSLAVVSQLVRGVRINSWQPGGVVRRAVNRKARVAFGELRAEAGGLAGTASQLRTAWLDSQGRVKTLNSRTADLKCQIRDECGPPGRRWFDDLAERREAFRIAEGKPV